MKAVFCTAYGTAEVLKIQETNRPTPKAGEVLIRVLAASVTAADSMMRKGEPRYARLFLGWKRPKNPIVGTGFSGIIEGIGKNVTSFEIGDEVFGETGLTFSSNAEYVCMPADGVILKKPNFLSFEEAAPMCDGALTSFNFLKEVGQVKAGQQVLINGASGSLGLAAIQIAKSMGAVVTGVCSNRNIALVQSMGADKVIDYTQKDFTKETARYDVIYDTVGKSSFSKCKKLLTTNGIYMSPVLDMTLLFNMIKTSCFGKKKALFQATGMRKPAELKDLLEELLPYFKNKKVQIVIDKKYQLEDAILAHHYVDTGRKRGNVILSMGI